MANLANTKWCQKPENWLKSWHIGSRYSSESTQQELSNTYQHDKVQMVFKLFDYYPPKVKIEKSS